MSQKYLRKESVFLPCLIFDPLQRERRRFDTSGNRENDGTEIRQIAMADSRILQSSFYANSDSGHLLRVDRAPSAVRVLKAGRTLGVTRAGSRTLVRISG